MSDLLWPQSPPERTIAPHEVHVWRAVLDQPSAVVQRLAALLAPDEQARAARFHFEHDRRHFIVARGVLRSLLGSYVEADPRTLRFSYGPQGKPSLEQPQAAALAFNVSHSGGLGLFAFARAATLGVDVERFKPMNDLLSIAEHFFSPSERAVLRALPLAEQQAGFFSCWTRKEAYIKAVGSGLSIPLDSFDVAFGPHDPPALLAVRGAGAAQRWQLINLEPGPGFAGALMIGGTGWQARCWEWQPAS